MAGEDSLSGGYFEYTCEGCEYTVPNEASVLRLVGAVLADMHDEWQAGDRRYLSDASMAELYPTRYTITVADRARTRRLNIENHLRSPPPGGALPRAGKTL